MYLIQINRFPTNLVHHLPEGTVRSTANLPSSGYVTVLAIVDNSLGILVSRTRELNCASWMRSGMDSRARTIQSSHRRVIDFLELNLPEQVEEETHAQADEGFAPNFNLNQWSGQNGLSRMQSQREELSSDNTGRTREVDLSSSQLSAGRTTLSWDTADLAEAGEALLQAHREASAAATYGAISAPSSEGQSG